MSFIREKIEPLLIDITMSSDKTLQQRKDLLIHARGDVLEIGFGTGLNLAQYPKDITSVTVIEPNAGMFERAQKRIAQAVAPVTQMRGSAEEMPFEDDRFDTVVSTWTLCSISDPYRAIGEVYRVLRLGGGFLFVEHGLSNRPRVARFQHLLNPLQNRCADGCNLDRDIKAIVSSQPFRFEMYKEYDRGGLLKTHTYTYQGVGIK